MSIHEELPKLKTEITLPKMFVAILTVGLFFGLPVYLISQFQAQINSGLSVGMQPTSVAVQPGRVAGVQTTSQNSSEFNFNSIEGVMILLGVLFLGISIILVLFLLMDNRGRKKYKY